MTKKMCWVLMLALTSMTFPMTSSGSILNTLTASDTSLGIDPELVWLREASGKCTTHTNVTLYTLFSKPTLVIWDFTQWKPKVLCYMPFPIATEKVYVLSKYSPYWQHPNVDLSRKQLERTKPRRRFKHRLKQSITQWGLLETTGEAGDGAMPSH